MKNNLGKILVILIFLCVDAMASTYKWSASANKNVAMTNEAIYLKYVCEYSDRAELYNIEFNPVVDNEKYTIELLSEQEKIVNAKKVNIFEFVLFIKEAGKQKFVFDTTMKKTNKDSIENTVLGRDNADYEEFSKRIIRQDAIVIDIKKSALCLVGTFELEVKKGEPSLNSYEPYNLELIIKGSGNFQALKAIEFEIDGVKVFSQKAIDAITLTKDGYRGSRSQKFAFVSEKNFKIPKQSIKYYDLKERTIKELAVEEIEVEVTPAYKKEQLLDAIDESFSFSYDFLYYILTFIAGFLVAKIKFKRVGKKDTKDVMFEVKIKNASSLQELMIILALKDSKKYEELIFKIETKELTSLKNVKNMLI